jgi:hypothetical protein
MPMTIEQNRKQSLNAALVAERRELLDQQYDLEAEREGAAIVARRPYEARRPRNRSGNMPPVAAQLRSL